MRCSGGTVSNKLRKLGLESHGKRLGGRRKARQAEPGPTPKEEESGPEAEEDDDWDRGPLYRKREEPTAESAPAPVDLPKKRRGRPHVKTALQLRKANTLLLGTPPVELRSSARCA
jgi:hypothetical protein